MVASAFHAASIQLETRVSFRGNLAMVMSLWPEGHYQVIRPSVITKHSFLSAVVEPSMHFISVLLYFDWLLSKVGLQVMHNNAASAKCNADFNVLPSNKTVVTRAKIIAEEEENSKQSPQTSYYQNISDKWNLMRPSIKAGDILFIHLFYLPLWIECPGFVFTRCLYLL